MSKSSDQSIPPIADVAFHGRTYPVVVPQFETDYIQGVLMRSGKPYEATMLEAMAEALGPDDLVLDVGANIGNHALFLAHISGCRLVAYEPNELLVDAVEDSVRRGGLEDRVTVRRSAVGAVSGRGRLTNLDESNLGGQSVVEDENGPVEIVRLDDQTFDAPVRAVKIDVEGMELDVLRGAETLIVRDRPLLFVESMDRAAFEAVLAWVGERGYSLAATFNATPTHLFRPAAPGEGIIEDSLLRAARTRYDMEERNGRDRRSLADLESTNAAALEMIEDLETALEQSIAESEQRLLDVRSGRSALKRVHNEALNYRRERDELNAQLQELAGRSQQQKAEVTRLTAAQAKQVAGIEAQHQKEIARLRRRLAKARNARRDLEMSKSVRMGEVFKASRKSPNELLRFPLEVVRVLRLSSPTPELGGGTEPAKALSAAPVRSEPGSTGAAVVHPTRARARYEPVIWAGGARGFDADDQRDRSESALRAGETLKLRLHDRTGLPRVAAITDDFTRNGLSVECAWQDLHPETWHQEMIDHDPDLLFVESAWRGESGAWHNTVPRLTRELQDILAYCREREIPTLFWNKEDPVHFDTFIKTAGAFDHVYTTDIDCIPRYRAALGHNRVHFMPFACQPTNHNPIEVRSRRDGLAFAGGYYTRYQERMRDLEALLMGAAEVMPVHIYDRMLGTTLEEYMFPEEYQPYVVGTLEPADLDIAYKGYKFALNLNSVKSSQSMFARRAYELLASGTVTVSNFSHGIRGMLGDLIPMGDSAAWIQQTLADLSDDSVAYDRLRLMGLRKVHTEHTYAARLRYLIASATSTEFELGEPLVGVLVPVTDLSEAERGLESTRRQTGVRVRSTFVTDDPAASHYLRAQGVAVLDSATLASAPAGSLAPGSVGTAVMHPRDWHGPTYLLDLALALTYAGTDVVGRAQYATATAAGDLVEGSRGQAYAGCQGLEPRTALVSAGACDALRASELLVEGTSPLEGLSQFSIDRFDYCRDGSAAPDTMLAALVGSSEGVDTGHQLAELYKFLDHANDQPAQRDRQILSAAALLDYAAPNAKVDVELKDHAVTYTASLEPDAHAYLWSRERVPVSQIAIGTDLRLSLQCDGDLQLMLAVRFFDALGNTLESAVKGANRNVVVPIPDGAEHVGFAVRVLGSGTSRIHEFSLDHLEVDPPILPSRGEYLVLTDHYPSNQDLYRNGFVHSRVRSYRHDGLGVDVFRLRAGEHLSYHKFEDVEVATGSAHALRETLTNGQYKHVLVHFLNPSMWEVLREFQDRLRITVWVHGAEVQPWWRRKFNFTSPEQLGTAKVASDARLAFWRDVLDHLSWRTHFVFVSAYFANEVMEDLERRIPAEQLHVIHNPVDTEIFTYSKKPAEQRKRILSIRPFASAKYANDLSVAAVLELSTEPWFSDLHFCFVGDGALFEATLEPLRAFENVSIHRGFLTQAEIASLHRDYGVFLVPTRMDAQGVSKDEAMSSGLVPVTSGVTAIPEFVSEAEGYLADLDDHTGLAEAIRDMYENPSTFLKKSEAAAARVRNQTAANVVIPAEVSLLRGEKQG